MQAHKIVINHEQCIGCSLCRRDCPMNNINITGNKAVVVSQACIKCGHCAAICPKAAVHITGYNEPPVKIEDVKRLDPRQLLMAIQTRRTIRQFKNKPVENDVIEKMIEAGRFTPTGGNAQDVSYIVLKDRIAPCEKIAVRFFRRLIPIVRLFSGAAKRVAIDDHFFFKKAAAVILVVSNDNVNGALAAGNMALMAEAQGLGVLYSGFFSSVAAYSRALRRTLGLKRGEKVVATLVIGYPAVKYQRTAQKDAATVRFL